MSVTQPKKETRKNNLLSTSIFYATTGGKAEHPNPFRYQQAAASEPSYHT
jgi:hypothetical protein